MFLGGGGCTECSCVQTGVEEHTNPVKPVRHLQWALAPAAVQQLCSVLGVAFWFCPPTKKKTILSLEQVFWLFWFSKDLSQFEGKTNHMVASACLLIDASPMHELSSPHPGGAVQLVHVRMLCGSFSAPIGRMWSGNRGRWNPTVSCTYNPIVLKPCSVTLHILHPPGREQNLMYWRWDLSDLLFGVYFALAYVVKPILH